MVGNGSSRGEGEERVDVKAARRTKAAAKLQVQLPDACGCKSYQFARLRNRSKGERGFKFVVLREKTRV